MTYARSIREFISRGIKTRNIFHLREKGIAHAVDAFYKSGVSAPGSPFSEILPLF